MEFRLQVALGEDEGAEDAVRLLRNLGEGLAELYEVHIEQLPDALPESTKDDSGLAGLLARVPISGIVALVQVVRAWVARTGRTVEISVGGDTIKISSAHLEQQDREIEASLLRRASVTAQEAEPAMQQDTEPGMAQEAEPAMQQDTEPGMAQEAEPAMQQDTEPGMAQEAEPGIEDWDR
jgi:hypothetical protein